MKSNPFPRGVNVAPPEPARTPGAVPAALADAYRGSRMNRDARALLAAARDLQEQLDAFRKEHDSTSAAREVFGRLGPALPRDVLDGICRREEAVGDAAGGALASLDRLVRAAEAYTLPAGD